MFTLSYSHLDAQVISSHQYRRVAPDKLQEYIKRETTYWQKFAEEEVKNGNLTFWGIFQKVGGIDQENSPNILIINNYNNIDQNVDWGKVADLFPEVKMENIETWSMSTNTDQIFLWDMDNHVRAENAEVNYVRIIYHDVKDIGLSLNFEAEKWKPMLEKAMAEGTTSMQGWGNFRILTPRPDNFQYDICTYDLFSSLQAALSPNFTDDHQMPDGFWEGMANNNNQPRNSHIYRVIASVSAADN
jgi:hypothetical protein